MRTLTVKKITLAVVMSSMALVANAAGLGRLNVLSSLGEPFKAEIDLISTTAEELETLTAVIASDEAYSAQGISRLSIHNDIQVALSKTGKPKLLLSSSKTVSDPYLDMLIQLDWASGRLQREYTILLDPPEYQTAAAPVPQVTVPQPQATLPTPEPITETPLATAEIIKPDSLPLAPVTPAAKPVTTLKPLEAQQLPTVGAKSESEIQAEINRIEMEAKSRYGAHPDMMSPSPAPYVAPAPIQQATPASKHRTISGDNLSKIARRLKVSGVSLNQMLVGLYEYNKDAFVNGNMNRLKVGKVIKLPTKEELLSVTRSQANQTVVVHTDNWQNYRQAVAGNASPSISVVDDKQSESGDITAFEPEKPIEAKETKDVVKLSKSDDAGAMADSGISVTDKQKEDSIAKDKALQEAQDRTSAVEKQIEDMQKLLKMKNDEMAEMEKKATANNAENEVENKGGFVDLAEQQPPTEATTEMPAEDAPVAEAPKPAPAPKAVPMPVAEEPTLWEKITDAVSLPILGGLGAILLLLFGLLFLRNKRKKDLENFERGILTSGGLRANTVFGNTTGDTSATDTSFLTDFAQTTDGAVMDANEVDPIAEAEVYMAYGREAQAEEILKEAIKKEPNRHELHLKLLEIYQDRKDNAAFETLASELYTTLGDEDPTWHKISEMGRVLEPGNPLYTQEDIPETQTAVDSFTDHVSEAAEASTDALEHGAESVAEVAGEVKDDLLDGGAAVADKTEDIADSAAAKAAGVAGLAGAAVSATGSRIESIVRHETKPEIEDAPELDVEGAGIQVEEQSIDLEDVSEIEMSAPETVESSEDDPQLQDFDLTGISLEIEEDTKQAVESVDDVDISLEAPEITLGDVDELPSEEILSSVNEESLDDNEVEIKLNLVSAYIDMDDKEGARELLEEVIKEGSDEQVMRAQMMKDSIS